MTQLIIIIIQNIWAWLLVFFLSSPLAQALPQTGPSSTDLSYSVEIGESLSLPLEASSTVFIEKKILHAQINGKRIKLTGKKTGLTKVRTGLNEYTVLVLTPLESASYQFLKLQFKDHPSLKVLISDKGLSLKGEALMAEDLSKALEWTNQTKPPQALHLDITYAEHIKPEIEAAYSHYFKQAVTLTNFHSVKFKSAPSEEVILKTKNLGLHYDFDEISIEPIGRLQIYFAEVKKSTLEKLSPLLLSTHPLENLSLGKVLNPEYSHLHDQLFSNMGNQAEIIIFDNQLAKIHSGGEFPILNQSYYSSEVSWKQFGLFLDVKGQDINSQSTILDLDFKLSMMTGSQSENNVPSLTSDSWKQKIRVTKNQTYILKSGFAKHHLQGEGQSLIFKNIPLLKFLFHSKTKNSGDTDVVLVLKLSPGV